MRPIICRSKSIRAKAVMPGRGSHHVLDDPAVATERLSLLAHGADIDARTAGGCIRQWCAKNPVSNDAAQM